MADQIITGLDIGSSAIRVVVGQIVPNEDGKSSLNITGAVEASSSGIHKGSISSMEDAVSSISKALELAEQMTGTAVNHAWVSIAGHNILVQDSRGVIGVSRADAEVMEEDVERVIDAARTVVTPSNYEILHVIPKSFTVDGQQGVKDPVGMSGIRLEVDALIVQSLSSHIKNVTKSIYRTGLDIDDLVFSPLATAEAVLTKRQKELGVCLVDIGATSSTLVVFEEGDLLHAAVLPIGGDHITHDIAIALRTSIDIAENIKRKIGNAVSNNVSPGQQYRLSDFGSSEEDIVQAEFVAQVIEARVEEIFEAVDDELRKIDRSGMLPVGLVLTGGAVKLNGVLDVAKRILRLPAIIGAPSEMSSIVDEIDDPAYSTAVGLAMWGFSQSSNKGSKFQFSMGNIVNVSDHMKKFIKKLIP